MVKNKEIQAVTFSSLIPVTQKKNCQEKTCPIFRANQLIKQTGRFKFHYTLLWKNKKSLAGRSIQMKKKKQTVDTGSDIKEHKTANRDSQ